MALSREKQLSQKLFELYEIRSVSTQAEKKKLLQTIKVLNVFDPSSLDDEEMGLVERKAHNLSETHRETKKNKIFDEAMVLIRNGANPNVDDGLGNTFLSHLFRGINQFNIKKRLSYIERLVEDFNVKLYKHPSAPLNLFFKNYPPEEAEANPFLAINFIFKLISLGADFQLHKSELAKLMQNLEKREPEMYKIMHEKYNKLLDLYDKNEFKTYVKKDIGTICNNLGRYSRDKLAKIGKVAKMDLLDYLDSPPSNKDNIKAKYDFFKKVYDNIVANNYNPHAKKITTVGKILLTPTSRFFSINAVSPPILRLRAKLYAYEKRLYSGVEQHKYEYAPVQPRLTFLQKLSIFFSTDKKPTEVKKPTTKKKARKRS